MLRPKAFLFYHQVSDSDVVSAEFPSMQSRSPASYRRFHLGSRPGTTVPLTAFGCASRIVNDASLFPAASKALWNVGPGW